MNNTASLSSIFTPHVSTTSTWDEFRKTLLTFDRCNRKTKTVTANGLDYFINDFWTARQRQAHRIHEISYRGCFKAELPEFFIAGLTAPGAVVFDPFMGRGTTVIQAALMDRQPIGNDSNPVCPMLVQPRLNPPQLAEIVSRLAQIPAGPTPPENVDLLTFFHPDTLHRINDLRSWFIDRQQNKQLDHIDEWIRMIALNRLTGHSSGFFSVYTMPPNQAVSAAQQRRLNTKRNLRPLRRDVDGLIVKKSKSLLGTSLSYGNHKAALGNYPAHDAQNIAAASIDLIVTSPPFLDVVDYVADNWLRMWFANISAKQVAITLHKTPPSWTEFVRESFQEFARILKKNAIVAFEVGEVRNGKIQLETLVKQALQDLAFNILGVVVNDQQFTKTANCWGVTNNTKGTNTNRIVLIQRC